MKLDAITSLPDGFENAVHLGTMPDSRERGVVDHYFAYPIVYKGKCSYVFCRAMQDANKNRLYVHEIFVSDKIKRGNTLQTAASKPHGGISLYRDILANVLDNQTEEVFTVPAVGESTNTNTSEVNSGIENGVTTPAGNSSMTSVGKDKQSTDTKQVKFEKTDGNNAVSNGTGVHRGGTERESKNSVEENNKE